MTARNHGMELLTGAALLVLIMLFDILFPEHWYWRAAIAVSASICAAFLAYRIERKP